MPKLGLLVPACRMYAREPLQCTGWQSLEGKMSRASAKMLLAVQEGGAGQAPTGLGSAISTPGGSRVPLSPSPTDRVP